MPVVVLLEGKTLALFICISLLMLSAAAAAQLFPGAIEDQNDDHSSMPCIYEGHLRSDKNWYGYLANVSVVNTGRLTFEFSYPAERCCQNVLFYSEDQVSIISARMNCWQKEYLLRPEDDQILRLTPRFTWSGCHLVHPNGIPTYICEGGRSFVVVEQQGPPGTALAPTRLTSWYVAVSHCATLDGLDLQYRLIVHGHVGECRSRAPVGMHAYLGAGADIFSPSSSFSSSPRTNLRSLHSPREALSPSSQLSPSDAVCVLEGNLNSTENWYGFLANVSFVSGGGFHFRVSYPYFMQVQNILLYSDEEVSKLHVDQMCREKEAMIRTRNAQQQILDLSFRSSWNGCVSKETGASWVTGRTLVCQGRRRYDEATTVFFAVSNCHSNNGLLLNYRLEIFGYANALCNCSPTVQLKPKTGSHLLATSLGVLSFTAAGYIRLTTV